MIKFKVLIKQNFILFILLVIGIALRINRIFLKNNSPYFTDLFGYRLFIEHFINYFFFVLLFSAIFFILMVIIKNDTKKEKLLFFYHISIIVILLFIISYIWEMGAGGTITPEQIYPNQLGIIAGIICSWFFYYLKLNKYLWKNGT